jgi:hypothetical protein
MKRFFFASAFFFLALFCLAPVGIAAQSGLASLTLEPPLKPDSLTFYIGEASASLSRTLPVTTLPDGSRAVRLALPGNVNKQSVQVTMNGLPVSSLTWEARPDWSTSALESSRSSAAKHPWQNYLTRTPDKESNPERKALLETLASLEAEESRHLGNIAAAEAAIALWKSGSIVAGRGPVDTIPGLAGNIEKEIPRLHTALAADRDGLFEVRRNLAATRHALYRFETANLSEVALVPVEDGKAQANIVCQYRMPAQATMRYRISARPNGKTLEIRQVAELTQVSGADWKDVDLSLALVNRANRLQPFTPSPWRLDYEPEAKRSNEMAYAAAPSAAGQAKSAAAEPRQAAPQTPQQVPMATYQLWTLGKRNLPHAQSTSVELASNSFAAEYYYTLRPATSTQGFLTASLTLPQVQEMPLGTADFFIDNDYAGSGRFSLNGNKATIFFGTDPQVTVVMRNLEAKKGEQGFISKDQTRVWHWEYTVRNMRPKPVDVVVEEAQPISGNESITLKVESTPAPQSVVPDDPSMPANLKLFVWKKTLEPKAEWRINHKVTAVFSMGKALDTNK